MSTARNIIRFFLSPTDPGDRIFRSSILLHWGVGLVPFSSTADWSLAGRVMAIILLLMTGALAGLFVFLAAQGFWRWSYRRRWRGLNADGREDGFRIGDFERRETYAADKEHELAASCSGSVVRHFVYLAPGIPLGWLLLLVWSFIHSSNRYA